MNSLILALALTVTSPVTTDSVAPSLNAEDTVTIGARRYGRRLQDSSTIDIETVGARRYGRRLQDSSTIDIETVGARRYGRRL